MSQENVEIVRQMFEAHLRGDHEAALAYYDPEVEFDATVRPDGRVFHGRDGVAEAMRVWIGTWQDYRFQVEEIIDAGVERVLAAIRESGRGKGSGLVMDQPAYAVFTVRQGLIVHRKGFRDRNEALEAAGLRE